AHGVDHRGPPCAALSTGRPKRGAPARDHSGPRPARLKFVPGLSTGQQHTRRTSRWVSGSRPRSRGCPARPIVRPNPGPLDCGRAARIVEPEPLLRDRIAPSGEGELFRRGRVFAMNTDMAWGRILALAAIAFGGCAPILHGGGSAPPADQFVEAAASGD